MMETITVPAFDLPHVRYAFFTRNGGVSTGVYDSLNCGFGSKDDRANIFENRALIETYMGAPITNVYQCHSADVADADRVFTNDDQPRADGMVTLQKNLVLGVLAADCTPVLFADKTKKIIGAAHAGWRGALSGVCENVVRRMQAAGADDIVAAIGPCIRQQSYEVGSDFPDAFLQQDQGNQVFFAPNAGGSYQFDLPGYIAARLARLGTQVFDCGLDTYADEKRFFSHRRDVTHNKKADYGRLFSCIILI